MSPVSLKKIVRRNRTKVADSFVITTKDGKVVRVKPIIITRTHASKPTATKLRKKARAFIAVTLRKFTFSQFVSEVIQRRFQKKLQELLKKIHPLSVCEIRAFTVLEDAAPKKEKAPAAAKEPVQESVKQAATPVAQSA